MRRFDYVKYDEKSVEAQNLFKKEFEIVERMVDGLENSRAKTNAMNALEEAYMWIGKALRDDQYRRNGMVELQESRKDG